MTAPDAAFRDRVLTLVGRIPAGRVMTYGQLAVLAGQPLHAREVGHIMHDLARSDLPWQRVINAQGRVSTDKLGFGDIQRGLLRQEGVAFDERDRCDLKRLQWWPEDKQGQPELF